MLTTAPSPEQLEEIRAQILAFLSSDAMCASGAIQERTTALLDAIVRRYFDGVANQRSCARVDWRVVHRLFSHIWHQSASEKAKAWRFVGEDLYGEIECIIDNPPTTGNSLSTPPPKYTYI